MGWGGGWGELFGVPNMFNQHLKSRGLLSQLFWWIWYFDVLFDAATQDLWQSSPDCRGQWIIQWVEILFQTYENIISLQNFPFSKHLLNLCTHTFLISYAFGPHFIATQSHLSGYHHWSAEAALKFCVHFAGRSKRCRFSWSAVVQREFGRSCGLTSVIRRPQGTTYF